MIKLLVMDVDGTMTDGKIYMGSQGELLKAFDVKDGYGIKELLPKFDIVPVIITARKSEMLAHRCKELDINELHQSQRDKIGCLSALLEKYNATLANVAYIGDDNLDLQCMKPIAEAGGMVGCPANATRQVADVCHYRSPHNGGDGAVRDFIEYIISKSQKQHCHQSIEERLTWAVEYIDHLDPKDLSLGKHIVDPDFFYNVIEYIPQPDDKVLFESHRYHIDIQKILAGEEWLKTTDASTLEAAMPYDSVNDAVLYKNVHTQSGILFRPSTCVVLMPNDAHKATRYGDKETQVKKIVGKLSI